MELIIVFVFDDNETWFYEIFICFQTRISKFKLNLLQKVIHRWDNVDLAGMIHRANDAVRYYHKCALSYSAHILDFCVKMFNKYFLLAISKHGNYDVFFFFFFFYVFNNTDDYVRKRYKIRRKVTTWRIIIVIAIISR